MIGISKITFQYILRLLIVFLILVIVLSSLFFQFFGLFNTLGFLLGASFIAVASFFVAMLVITNTKNLHEKLQTNYYYFSINSSYLTTIFITIGFVAFLAASYVFLRYINQISTLPFVVAGITLFFLITNLVVSTYLWFVKTSKSYLFLVDQKNLRKETYQALVLSEALVSNLELINGFIKLILVLTIFGIFVYLTEMINWILIGSALLAVVFCSSYQILNYYLAQTNFLNLHQLISRKNNKSILSNLRQIEKLSSSYNLVDLTINILTLFALSVLLYQEKIYQLTFQVNQNNLLSILISLTLTLGFLKVISIIYVSSNESILKKLVILFKRKSIKETLTKKPFLFFSFVYENSLLTLSGLIFSGLIFSLTFFLSVNYLGVSIVSIFLVLIYLFLITKLFHWNQIFGTIKNIDKKNNILFEKLEEERRLINFLRKIVFENLWIFAITSLVVGAFLNAS